MQNRAYQQLDVKAVDEQRRIFRGVATTPTVDRVGDVINPLGVIFDNPMPLLHQHAHDKPVGHVRFKKPTKTGIEFEAEIIRIDEPGLLKDRVDLAWQEIREGLVRATSIGFKPNWDKAERLDDGGILYNEVEVYELSTVTIPANADAKITEVVKSYDDAALLKINEPMLAKAARETGRQASAIIAGIINGNEFVFDKDATARIGVDLSSIEIPAPLEPAASGKEVRVVRLDDSRPRPAFVIQSVLPLRA